MKKVSRLTESDLNRIIKRTIMEMGDGAKNASEIYDMKKSRMENGIYQLKDAIEKGDKETALHIAEILIYSLKELDSYVQDMKK